MGQLIERQVGVEDRLPNVVRTLNAPRAVSVFVDRTFIRNRGRAELVEVTSPNEVVVLEDQGSRATETAVIVNSSNVNEGVGFYVVSEEIVRDGPLLCINDCKRTPKVIDGWSMKFDYEGDRERFKEFSRPMKEGNGFVAGVVNQAIREILPRAAEDMPVVMEVSREHQHVSVYYSNAEGVWDLQQFSRYDRGTNLLLSNLQVVASIDQKVVDELVKVVERGEFVEADSNTVAAERRIVRTFVMDERRTGLASVQEHVDTVRTVTAETLSWALHTFGQQTGLLLDEHDKGFLEMWLFKRENDYADAIRLSRILALSAQEGKRVDPTRSVFENPRMMAMTQRAREAILPTAYIFVLGGLVLESQRGGLKQLHGMDTYGFRGQYSHIVNDVLGSATALNLGAEHPLTSSWDIASAALGIRSNFCMPYHPAVSHVVACEQMISHRPNKDNKVYIQTEGSGTMVNNWAITGAVAYATKEVYGTFDAWTTDKSRFLTEVAQRDPLVAARLSGNEGWEDLALLEATGHIVTPKVFITDGTWCGGSGPAQEGTAFGTDTQHWYHGGPRWVRRDLPVPTLENKERYLSTVQNAINAGELAGVILEPIVGDAGIIVADTEVVNELVEILRRGYKGKSLPLIVDTIQQGAGRTGFIWGTEHLPSVENYPLTVITGGKSLGGGAPFGMLMMPHEIAQAAYPLSTITTNSFNGGYFNAALVTKYLSDPRIQAIIDRNSQVMDEAAAEHGMTLRGMRMNRALETGSPEGLELIMWHNLLTNGILVGALPSAVRFQPMLLEHEDSVRAMVGTTCRAVKDVLNGNIPDYVLRSYQAAANQRSGLNR